jgi:Ca-activated chloride channel family protein
MQASYLNSKQRGFPVLEGGENLFIPLKETQLTGNIFLPFADLTLEQTFLFSSKEYNKTIEAIYRFPMSGNAAVRDVHIKFGDTEIKTELKKRQNAEEEYQHAKEQGKQAALVSRDAPNVFILRVAGIHPDEEVNIKTHYVQILRPIDGGYEFRLPLTTAPRFVRDDEIESRHAKGEPLALMLDPQHRFSMRVSIFGASEISSPTHDIKVRDNIATISNVIPNRDLILNLISKKKETPSLKLIKYNDGKDLYFGVLASPPIATKKVKILSFVETIDHSGSMSGPKWDISDFIAKMTYAEIKEVCSEAHICAFDTQTWWITVKNQSQLEKFLEKRYGGGGTHLGTAIEESIHKHTTDDIAYNVIITDAQVSDYGRLIRLAKVVREENQRLIIICIDSAPNSFIPIEMARQAGGLCFFLNSNAEGDMVNAVEYISRYWKDPIGAVQVRVVSDKDITLEHSQGLQSDNILELGDLTKNLSRWAVGRIKGDIHSNISLELLVDGEKVDEISLEKGQEHKITKDIFGIHRVNYLECLINARYTPENLERLLSSIGYEIKLDRKERIYSENVLKITREQLDDLLANIALEFGLASKETSFVAITEREGKVEDTIAIPNALPEGWVMRSVGSGPPSGPPGYMRGAMKPPSGPAPSAPPPREHHRRDKSIERANIMSSLGSAFGKKKKEKSKSHITFDRLSGASAPVSKPQSTIIFEGLTEKGVFFKSSEKIKLSSIEVFSENVPKDAKIFIYLKNDSTPVATIDLRRVKMLGKRPLNIQGIVRIESNLDGIKIKIT